MRLLLTLILISFTVFSQDKMHVDAIFEGKITYQTYNMFIKKISKAPNKKVYNVVINSGGGYLDVTNNMIVFLKTLRINEGKKWVCHLVTGASGAASIFANCDERIVYINSIWAQHQAGTIGGHECIGNCFSEDIRRLETEAKIFKQKVTEYRRTLPMYGQPLLTITGKGIYNADIATKFINRIFLEGK